MALNLEYGVLIPFVMFPLCIGAGADYKMMIIVVDIMEKTGFFQVERKVRVELYHRQRGDRFRSPGRCGNQLYGLF